MQIRRINHIAVLFLAVLMFAVFETNAQTDKKMENFCTELKSNNLTTAINEVRLIGEVIAPQKLKFQTDLTLSIAIATAGGFSRKANSKQIHIIKCSADYKLKSVTVFDYVKIRKGIEKDLKLEGGDIILVPPKKEVFSLINPHLISGEN